MKKLHHWFIGDYLEKTDDVFERARIELLYYYSLCFFVLGGAFWIELYIDKLMLHFYLITFPCIALFSIPFLLKYTKNINLVAWWYVVQQTITAIISVYFEKGAFTQMGAYWTVLYILCVLFLFGIRTGLILSVANGVIMGITAGLSIANNENFYQLIPDVPKYNTIPLLLNVCVAIMFIKFRGNAGKEIARQKAELEERNKEVKDSIAYAERIQTAILPSHRTVEYMLPGSFVVYLPKDIVSGDFYWVEKKENISLVAVCDCTGHGVPGAMMSVICNNALNRTINGFRLSRPSEILDKLNEVLEQIFAKGGTEIRDGMDIALCAINYETRTVHYAGANNSMYYFSKGEIHEVKADRQPIGRFESKVPFKNHTIQLDAGDFVYLFSDGIADQFGGPQGKKFKYKRVKEILQANARKPVNEQKNAVLDGFRAWKGNIEQVDDVCLMGVRL